MTLQEGNTNKPLKAKVPYVLTCSQVGVMNVVILSRSHHEANRPKPTEELCVLYEAGPRHLWRQNSTHFALLLLLFFRLSDRTRPRCQGVCVSVSGSTSRVRAFVKLHRRSR
jgi:hypothetical protein